jgi:superfamily II DNA/RNA helicase
MVFSDFALSERVVSGLTARGITVPSPIQEESLPFTLEGRDVLGRARTGTGKTLAFGLPISMRLEASRERGRKTRAIILAPTRELAKQVAKELELCAAHLAVTTIYGGTSYGPQERDLQRGVDVVVGTPGRVIDHLDRGTLDLSEVEIAVLDEADEMLSMGFQDAVERVLKSTPKERQTMLFSATIPRWVDKLAKGYLNNPKKVDLVGEESAAQASTTQHIAVRVNPAARTKTLADLLTVLAPERAIIFTRTKKDCDELALELIHRGLEAEAIHGDLAQSQRERALEGFRAGRTRVLVATDVAARGIDIPDVELVVQHHFPNDSEAYVHRSGRTGRAGRSGTAVVLYTDREQRQLKTLEHEAGVFFERKDPPKPTEVAASAAKNAAKVVRSVPESVIAQFRAEAEALAEEFDIDALARALAWIAGIHQAPKPASLITGEEGMTTVLLRAPRLGIPRAVAVLAQVMNLPSKALGKIKPFKDGVAADVPTSSVEALLAQNPLEGQIEIERAETLPELIDLAPRNDRAYQDRGSSNDRRPREGGYQSGGSRGGYRGNRDSNSSTSQSAGGAPREGGASRDANRGPYKPQRKRY